MSTTTIINPTPRGSYAEVISNLDINTGAAKSAVENVFGIVFEEYAQLRSETDTLTKALVELAEDFDIPDINAQAKKVSVDPVTYPSARNFGELVLNSAWPKELPIKPNFKEFGDLNFECLEPVPPEEFEGSFSWKGEQYNSELRTALTASIYNEIVNGNYGLPSNVFQTLIDKERNARLRQQAEQMRDALSASGESGFILGMGSYAQRGIIAGIEKAQVHADQDALNAVTRIDFDFHQRNREFFHTLALDADRVFSEELNSSEQRRFEADRATFELGLKAVQVSLETYLKKFDGIKIKAEVFKTKNEAIESENRSKKDMFLGEIEAYAKQVDAVGAENASKVQIRGMSIEQWAKEVDATAKEDQSKIARARFEFDQIRNEIETELRVQGVNIEGFKTSADLKAAILEALAKMSNQAAASLIGAISAGASLGFTGSESLQRSLRDSASVTENASVSLTQET
jgi:hypothetical protein